MIKIISTFNTKGGVGKSTVLQQVVLPATQKTIYIDTDKMNLSSKHVEKSIYIDQIAKHTITNKDDIAKLIVTVTELLEQHLDTDTFILIDPPAADSASNILEVLYAFGDYVFVLIPTLSDESDSANTEKVVSILQKNDIRHAIISNKTNTNNLYLDNLSAVLDFANQKQKTIYELADTETTELKDKAFINLINRVYKSKLSKTIAKVKELLT